MTIYCLENNFNPPAKPQIFSMSQEYLLPEASAFSFPAFNDFELYAQCELVMRISKGGRNIQADGASAHYDGITAGISFTALEIQKILNGLEISWSEAKAWKYSRAAGLFFPARDLDFEHLHFCVYHNRDQAQMADVKEMTRGLDEALSLVSGMHELREGDLIFTGSPGGFFPVQPGDTLETFLEDDSALELTIGDD